MGINENDVDGGKCVKSDNDEGGVCVNMKKCVIRVLKKELEI